jgi:hypothetical protein
MAPEWPDRKRQLGPFGGRGQFKRAACFHFAVEFPVVADAIDGALFDIVVPEPLLRLLVVPVVGVAAARFVLADDLRPATSFS